MTPLQTIIDPFVRRMNGKLISDLMPRNCAPPNADYLFSGAGVIAELKTLRSESFGPAFCQRMGQLAGNWHNSGRLFIYGTSRIDSGQLSRACQEEIFEILAPPIQKHVVGDANRQIRSTKRYLNLPDAKGLLWVASDGNFDLHPHLVMFLLNRALQKRNKNGKPAYSNIQAVIYFNPRMPVRIPEANEPGLLWIDLLREPDPRLESFLEELGSAWPAYVAEAQGITVKHLDGLSASLDGLRFLGVNPRLPRIEVKYGAAESAKPGKPDES
jgi:hypothetical protein